MMRDPKTDPIPAPDPATPTVAAPAPINLAAESISFRATEVEIFWAMIEAAGDATMGRRSPRDEDTNIARAMGEERAAVR